MTLKASIASAINTFFHSEREGIDLSNKIVLNSTRKEFDGDYTLVVFPFSKMAKKSPQDTAEAIGEYLKENVEIIEDFNVIKGFLNLSLKQEHWTKVLTDLSTSEEITIPKKDKKVIVEFSSPNTNKPLHLGHIRNILLGWSISKILKSAGYDVLNTQIVNDRGIAVCKSMLAWQLYGDGETPESSGIKGDHLIGKYYVIFSKKIKEEYAQWQKSEEGSRVKAEQIKDGEEASVFFKRYENTYFNEYSKLGLQAKEMLQKWEQNDTEIRALWKKMNDWVYAGFEITYNNLGVHFDKLYYESDTYLLGKDIIEEELKVNQFYKKDDGSVWMDLEDVGLDHKLVLRSDGTSVYMTQDIGTAEKRYENHGAEKMIYVVGNEQDYHFKALFEILKKLGRPYADGLYHLSYGMVDLPSGRMKSREGTVVDADDLMNEVIGEAAKNASEREIQLDIPEAEKTEINRKVGMAALKYFILKVNPKKRMVFDPKESVDMKGDTGPYIQNAFVRIQSILRNYGDEIPTYTKGYTDIKEIEKELLVLLDGYPRVIEEAAAQYDPSQIASFSYQLAKTYHRFYNDVRILKAESEEAKSFRLNLCRVIGIKLAHSMDLLGVEMPEKM